MSAEVAFASGIGFKFAQEQILGTSETFDESFLADLEPLKKRPASFVQTTQEESIFGRKRYKAERFEPFPSFDSSALGLNPTSLELVVELIGDSEEDEEDWDLNDLREFALTSLQEFIPSNDEANLFELTNDIEKEIRRTLGTGDHGEDVFPTDTYLHYIAGICDMLKVECVRKHVLSGDISVRVLVDSTISNMTVSKGDAW
eukprot:CAMPEP_0203751576 /NCGR_PEP_ID=MMETSP0098-20131031/5621_1 /ASSEMBLY_ACC=CAM_ASM_000208 /TAXON_ID=96639 /ORGANISM=" , Strain NY0313808BC1" /LENGTH=201 /DNA_ID=CAMNT_0050641353 /DNA_START=439 /DNA_END=1041 /DNA_ORIENTATION=+